MSPGEVKLGAGEGPAIWNQKKVEIAEKPYPEHYEIISAYMEHFRDRFCPNTADGKDVLSPLESADNSKWDGGKYQEAADYLIKKYGNDDLDFCARGTGGGLPAGFAQNEPLSSSAASYILDTTSYGLLFTDSLPLCEAINYSLTTQSKRLPEEIESIVTQFSENVKNLSEEDKKLFTEKKGQCLNAIKKLNHSKYNGNAVDLEWLCMSALETLDPEDGIEKDEGPSALLKKKFAERLGPVPWNEWVVLGKEVCDPFIKDGSEFNSKKWIYLLTGGGGIIVTVLLRLRGVFSFTKVITEVFGIRTLIRKIWKNIKKGPDDPNGTPGGGNKQPVSEPEKVPVAEKPEVPVGETEPAPAPDEGVLAKPDPAEMKRLLIDQAGFPADWEVTPNMLDLLNPNWASMSPRQIYNEIAQNVVCDPVCKVDIQCNPICGVQNAGGTNMFMGGAWAVGGAAIIAAEPVAAALTFAEVKAFAEGLATLAAAVFGYNSDFFEEVSDEE